MMNYEGWRRKRSWSKQHMPKAEFKANVLVADEDAHAAMKIG
jgi:hypothetical protein